MLNQRVSIVFGILLIIISSMIVSCSDNKNEPPLKPPIKKTPPDKETLKPSVKETLPKSVQKKYPPIKKKYAQYKKISFDLLAGYDYMKSEKIPDSVKVLDKEFVTLTGYMLPVDYNKKSYKVKSFILLKEKISHIDDHAGRNSTLELNEIVIVKMKVPCGYFPDVPIRVYGRLSVGEYYKKDILESIYRMKGELLVPPKGSEALH